VGNSNALENLEPYLKPNAGVQILDGLAVAPIDFKNPHTRANAVYFDNHAWASGYFRACHRDDAFKDRWQRAIGNWNDKVIVDIGCGPGNLFARSRLRRPISAFVASSFNFPRRSAVNLTLVRDREVRAAPVTTFHRVSGSFRIASGSAHGTLYSDSFYLIRRS
jgi:hypothetical protein